MEDNKIQANGKGCIIAFFMVIPHLLLSPILYFKNSMNKETNIIFKCIKLIIFLIVFCGLCTSYSPTVLCIVLCGDWFILAILYSILSFEEVNHLLFVEWVKGE
jgi:hypothetical protein